MKKRLFNVVSLWTAIGFLLPVFAYAGQNEQPPPARLNIVQEASAEMQAGIKSVGAMVQEGKLNTIHQEIEKIEANSIMVQENTGFMGEKKIRLDAALHQLNAQLDKLHHASDNKDTEKAKTAFKKSESALKLVTSNLK